MNSPHRMLTELDHTGFGVKYESNLSAYTPPHWHKAVELLLFVKGIVTCSFHNAKRRFQPGDLYIINSHEVHETRCSRGARYLVVHIDPVEKQRYIPAFDQLRFSLAFDPEDTEKAQAIRQLRLLTEQILALTEEVSPVSLLQRQGKLFEAAAILVTHFSRPCLWKKAACSAAI